MDGPAAQPHHVIDGGLEHSVCGADEVGLLGTHRDRRTLLPIRFGGITEDRSRIGIPGEVVRPHKHRAKSTCSQSTDRLQESPALQFRRDKWCHAALTRSRLAQFISSRAIVAQPITYRKMARFPVLPSARCP